MTKPKKGEPSPNTRAVTFRFPPDVIEKLKATSEAESRSMSGELQHLVRQAYSDLENRGVIVKSAPVKEGSQK